jgi:hypothetical protein
MTEEYNTVMTVPRIPVMTVPGICVMTATLVDFVRRKGWRERHQLPLLITQGAAPFPNTPMSRSLRKAAADL